MATQAISGSIVDIINRKIFSGTLHVLEGRIHKITEDSTPKTPFYILPGFIDAHVHVESSMLIPSEFARLASVHGTVATVSDPHEIGNVLGIEGVRYMIHNGQQVPFHFYFGAPSCVPATQFETSGALLTAKDIETLFLEDQLKYLSEMMNYPGVLSRDPEVLKKLQVAHSLGKPVDGHAPGLIVQEAANYIAAGISTDHECVTFDEALHKVKLGMHILMREVAPFFREIYSN
jgi:adenine deaminase